MSEKCVACGKPIHTVRANHPIVTLNRVWVHYSMVANWSHSAIPESKVQR
ncbi:hypothetical protein LWF01_02850 [Saxibacter everestensis]|uniref:Uncharacterized protein n=1 Tax=Saxibacter everestensis TaxID=2909229 RepID=A0ABY8QUN4_9MICO|nr:hypothetical protein LWF01_02850 [Brevibacteriaceae bacterium ZFBP1038]